jgi:hypothetical protein
VLAVGDRAREVSDNPVWIRGIEHIIEAHGLGVRDLAQSPSTKAAGEKAGVDGVDVAELHAPFSHQEPILRDALGLSNGVSINPSGGAVVTGFTKVEIAIRDSGIAALLHSAEAAEDGRRKLHQALRKRYGDAISGIPVIAEFAGEELDLALGRSHVIHAGLVAGAGSDGFLARWRKLCTYRGVAVDPSGPQMEPGDAPLRNPQEPERNE